MPTCLPTDYKAIFSAAATACLVLDTELTIIDFNDAYLQVTGRPPASLLGRSLFEAFPETANDETALSAKAMRESLRRVAETRIVDEVGILQYDIPIGPPDSGRFEKRFWAPINSPVVDQEGRLTHILHQVTDVTARVAAETARREGDNRFKALIDASADVIYRMSADWTQMHELDGRGFLKDTQALSEWRIEDYIPAENVQTIRRAIETAIRTKSTFDMEHPVLRSDGTRGWTHSRAVPILDARGNIAEWIGVATDVSARKQVEEQMVEASRRKDEFLAMLAHELRNPLAPIAAAADLLRLGAHDEARVRRSSEIVGRQVRHLTGLVDDLLDVSRVTRGRVTLDSAPVDMRAVIHNAIEQVRPLIEGRRHRLLLQTTPYSAMVNGDEKRLTQVVANLLANAAKYTPEQGEISARLEQSDEHVFIVVSDNGIGMGPELMANCFEMFVQADRTSERAAGGLGIGLALVSSLVELHRGNVDVRSEGEGRGSTFSVTLPKLRSGAADSTAAAAGLPLAASRLRVFVVDDNADAAEMLAMLVEGLGHTALVETHSTKGLERIIKERPDVCLLDVGMPVLDGHELARAITAKMDVAPVLVAITGYSQPHDRVKSLGAGFTEHFAKPVDSVALAKLLASISRPD